MPYLSDKVQYAHFGILRPKRRCGVKSHWHGRRGTKNEVRHYQRLLGGDGTVSAMPRERLRPADAFIDIAGILPWRRWRHQQV